VYNLKTTYYFFLPIKATTRFISSSLGSNSRILRASNFIAFYSFPARFIDRVTQDGQNLSVPKRDLAGTLQVLLQNGRLKVSGKLKLGSVLQREMLDFRVKIDPVTAQDSYSA
jgi:hypothetical protein